MIKKTLNKINVISAVLTSIKPGHSHLHRMSAGVFVMTVGVAVSIL